MDRGAGLERLEMRSRLRVTAGWCWVSAAAFAAAVADSGTDIVLFYFGYGVCGSLGKSVSRLGCC